MQHLEVSGAVWHIYIYDIRPFKVKHASTNDQIKLQHCQIPEVWSKRFGQYSNLRPFTVERNTAIREIIVILEIDYEFLSWHCQQKFRTTRKLRGRGLYKFFPELGVVSCHPTSGTCQCNGECCIWTSFVPRLPWRAPCGRWDFLRDTGGVHRIGWSSHYFLTHSLPTI